MKVPTIGFFSVATFARFLGCNRQTVRGYVVRYSVPVTNRGIDAAAWWKAIAERGEP